MSSPRRRYFETVLIGCLLIGAAYAVSLVALAGAGYTYDARPGTPIIGNPRALTVFGTVLFAIPYGIGTLYFRNAFREYHSRTLTIASALLLAWVVEKTAILAIGSFVYGIDIWRIADLVQRISAGGDQLAPWFTANYVFATLIGCVVLGFVAALGTKRRFLHGSPSAS